MNNNNRIFQPNSIQKLYPNLKFHKIAPTEYNQPTPPKRSVSEPPVQTKPPSPQKPSEQIPKPLIKEAKKVEIREPTPPKSPVIEPSPPTPPKPKEKIKRPNRVKPDPKPKPDRASTIPNKGERGLQRKYTIEQKKEMFLNKLSRKSVKNAEKEISKINEVIEQSEGDLSKLEKEEKALKSRLKLINTAKFFSNKNDMEKDVININNDCREITPIKESSPQKPSSPCSSQGSSRGD